MIQGVGRTGLPYTRYLMLGMGPTLLAQREHLAELFFLVEIPLRGSGQVAATCHQIKNFEPFQCRHSTLVASIQQVWGFVGVTIRSAKLCFLTPLAIAQISIISIAPARLPTISAAFTARSESMLARDNAMQMADVSTLTLLTRVRPSNASTFTQQQSAMKQENHSGLFLNRCTINRILRWYLEIHHLLPKDVI